MGQQVCCYPAVYLHQTFTHSLQTSSHTIFGQTSTFLEALYILRRASCQHAGPELVYDVFVGVTGATGLTGSDGFTGSSGLTGLCCSCYVSSAQCHLP